MKCFMNHLWESLMNRSKWVAVQHVLKSFVVNHVIDIMLSLLLCDHCDRCKCIGGDTHSTHALIGWAISLLGLFNSQYFFWNLSEFVSRQGKVGLISAPLPHCFLKSDRMKTELDENNVAMVSHNYEINSWNDQIYLIII